MKKSFWPNLPPIIECDKAPGTVYISSEASVTVTLEKLRSFLQDLRGCWKHIFFGKKANFPVRKSFWPDFYRIFEFDKPQGTVSISSEASMTITDEKLRSFLQDLRGCWKNNFWKKKAVYPVRKKIWPAFPRIIECHKPQKTLCKGRKNFVTITVVVIRSIL